MKKGIIKPGFSLVCKCYKSTDIYLEVALLSAMGEAVSVLVVVVVLGGGGWYSKEFEVKVSVHLGSVFSPLLFIIVLEALSQVPLWGPLGGPLCR